MKPLRECQVQAIQYAIKNRYAILALDPGLGKSRSAIEVIKYVKQPALVVCPAYLVTNWANEFKTWAPELSVTLVKKGSDIKPIDSDVTIISYDLAQKAEHFFDKAKVLILDESHLLKSMKAKRTQFFHRVIYENSLPYVIQLTGTPIKNRTEEFYSLLSICYYLPQDPKGNFLNQFPDSITFANHFSFRHEYDVLVRNMRMKLVKWKGIRNVDELKTWLKNCYLKIKSADVLDLPAITFKDVIVSNSEDKELLEDFQKYFENEDNRGVNPTAKAEAALKMTDFTIKYAESLLEEVDCLLIYTDHVLACQKIADHFKVAALTGQVSAHKRMEIAKRFQDGEGQVLVATIGSMSTGINLTRTSHLIISDPSWTPGDLKQVYHRIQRLGQASRCFVHRMIGSPQTTYIYRALEEKIAVIEKAT